MLNNYDFSEMSNLYLLLCDADIPCEVRELFDGLQLCYPNSDNCVCDAIIHKFSYGHEKGLLEIMGLVDDDVDDEVQGYLTGENVFNRIKAHYESQK